MKSCTLRADIILVNVEYSQVLFALQTICDVLCALSCDLVLIKEEHVESFLDGIKNEGDTSSHEHEVHDEVVSFCFQWSVFSSRFNIHQQNKNVNEPFNP